MPSSRLALSEYKKGVAPQAGQAVLSSIAYCRPRVVTWLCESAIGGWDNPSNECTRGRAYHFLAHLLLTTSFHSLQCQTPHTVGAPRLPPVQNELVTAALLLVPHSLIAWVDSLFLLSNNPSLFARGFPHSLKKHNKSH
jgi:hypothetical protein